mgnify:CR=1 FL=1
MKWERAEKMFAHSGLSLTEGQFHQFSTYQEILVETNRRMNLTTITEDGENIFWTAVCRFSMSRFQKGQR